MTRVIRMMKGMFRSLFGGAPTPMIGCEEALEKLFEYLDGELDPASARQIETHLEVCKRCYPRAQFERSFLEALAQTHGTAAATPELRARILAALEEEDD